MEVETDNGIDMQMSSAATTIDPSVIQSRILQSASLQKEDTTAMDESDQPVFPQISAAQANGNRVEYRRVRCPAHRYTPLREHWEQILTPLVEYLKLQVRLWELSWVGRRVATQQMMIYPHFGMFIVLFLELQTLREASMLLGTKVGDQSVAV